MRVPVMNIRVVRVLVHEHLVPMQMRMGRAAVPFERMFMLVVLVVPMAVTVLEWLVRVLVLVALLQVQPDAECHESRGCQEQDAG